MNQHVENGYTGYYIDLPKRGWNILTRSLPYSDGGTPPQTAYPVSAVLSRTLLVYKRDKGRLYVARQEDVPQTEGDILIAEMKSVFKDELYLIAMDGRRLFGYDNDTGVFFEKSLAEDGTFRLNHKTYGLQGFARFFG